LRDLGLRGLDVREVQQQQAQQQENEMAVSLRDTAPQGSPVPKGVYKLRIHIKPGGHGSERLLRLAKNMRSLMLETEFSIVSGDYSGRTFWDYLTVEIDETEYDPVDNPEMVALDAKTRDKLLTNVRIGRERVRAILDSALAVDPNDKSETAWSKRESIKLWGGLERLEFLAYVVIKPANGDYRASNRILDVVTCDMDEWTKWHTPTTRP
jgi:hypothetical protein